jgi:hypothetical protein
MLENKTNQKKLYGRGLTDVFNRLNKKYSKIAKTTGADKLAKSVLKTQIPTLENKLKNVGVTPKILTPLMGQIKKQVGSGFFDDLLSTLSVLPIPFVSDIARTVSLVKTAVNTATSDEPVKAFGGVVTDIGNKIGDVVPPLKAITEPAVALGETIGFGTVSPSDRVKIVKVGVEHLDDLFSNIDKSKLDNNKRKQIESAHKSIKQALPEIKNLKVGGMFGRTEKKDDEDTYGDIVRRIAEIEVEKTNLSSDRENQKRKREGKKPFTKKEIEDKLEALNDLKIDLENILRTRGRRDSLINPSGLSWK